MQNSSCQTAAIVIGSLLVAYGRFLIPGHTLSWDGAYEAFAHIVVGALLLLCFQEDRGQQRAARWSLVLITLLEIVMFALFKHAQR